MTFLAAGLRRRGQQTSGPAKDCLDSLRETVRSALAVVSCWTETRTLVARLYVGTVDEQTHGAVTASQSVVVICFDSGKSYNCK